MLFSKLRIIEKDLQTFLYLVGNQEKMQTLMRGIVLVKLDDQRLQEWDMRLFLGEMLTRGRSQEENLR